MTKYRIKIETRRNGNISYQVQYLFDAISSWSDGDHFDSIEEAEEYLDKMHSTEILNTQYVDYVPKIFKT